ncbi:scaffolding protein [Streptococcus oralis subsp. tigurinus]|uniref:Scaffolding protein n=1 Tax=Streptococcus oralis subsp. tigurinus TaxID=1077464 RepID=A0A1X0WYF4_STROR|nr:phage scaffolding protein [Streptococcus oralis]ORJ31792.1 scaffolding protein [Streptococcus oralis subsp. tigurinus]
MAFTTEELLNLGLTEEQAKSVFALRGKELNEDKSAFETIKQERDSLKDQLQNAQSQLAEMQSDANTSEETKKALASLQSEYDKYKEQADAEIAQIKKVSAINLALKDTNAFNPDKLMKFIDVDAIQLDDNGKPQIDEVINSLKESDPYLFKAEESKPSPNILPQGNPAGEGTSDVDPFQAIIDGYGK